MIPGVDKKKIVEQDGRLESQTGFLCFNIEAEFLFQKSQSLLLRGLQLIQCGPPRYER